MYNIYPHELFLIFLYKILKLKKINFLIDLDQFM
jgi:hypothetical protein